MSSPLENPAVRYGMGLSSAAILVLVAFFFLDGTIQWLVPDVNGVSTVERLNVCKGALYGIVSLVEIDRSL